MPPPVASVEFVIFPVCIVMRIPLLVGHYVIIPQCMGGWTGPYSLDWFLVVSLVLVFDALHFLDFLFPPSRRPPLFVHLYRLSLPWRVPRFFAEDGRSQPGCQKLHILSPPLVLASGGSVDMALPVVEWFYVVASRWMGLPTLGALLEERLVSGGSWLGVKDSKVRKGIMATHAMNTFAKFLLERREGEHNFSWCIGAAARVGVLVPT
eukprot:Gb_02692 [translate_table: standard]